MNYHSERNQIYIDIVPNVVYNNKKEFPIGDEIGENL